MADGKGAEYPETEVTEEQLRRISQACVDFVCHGKGEARHGHGTPVGQQPWVGIEKHLPNFCASQAVKKVIEASRMTEKKARIAELKGAVGYLLLKIAQEVNS